eukprot:13191424-Alexandrium_andersonii.AAC.1
MLISTAPERCTFFAVVVSRRCRICRRSGPAVAPEALLGGGAPSGIFMITSGITVAIAMFVMPPWLRRRGKRQTSER